MSGIRLANKAPTNIIYDLGANCGDNLPYYLAKAEKVVAVEVNPVLIKSIENKYSKAIALGRLKVVHCALADSSRESVTFYVHKYDSRISMISPPDDEELDCFEVINVPSLSVLDLLSRFGNPSYVKIDLEGFDAVALKQLFDAKIYPDYISAEAHSVFPFSLMEHSGQYNSYQIMDARSFTDLPDIDVSRSQTDIDVFQFHEGTAGPFGSDIPSPWMSKEQCLLNLGIAGLGWRDVHARKQLPDSDARVFLEKFSLRSLVGAIARKTVLRPWANPNRFV